MRSNWVAGSQPSRTGFRIARDLHKDDSISASELNWQTQTDGSDTTTPPRAVMNLLETPTQRSVTEVAHPGKHHRHATLVGSSNHLIVAHRAARLDDAGGTGIDHHVQTIAKRKERIACDHGASQ